MRSRVWAGAILGLALFLFFSWAYAQHQRQQSYSANGAYLMKVPLSGAAWVNPEQQTGQQGVDDLRKEMAEMRKDLQRIIKLLEDAVGPEPGPAAASRTPPQALLDGLNTCVQCHAAAVAAKKGEGFVIFATEKNPETGKDESVFRDDFNRKELRNMIREIGDGSMPKKSSGKRLTPEQKTAMLTELQARLNRQDQEEKKQ